MKEMLRAILRYMATHPARPVPEPTKEQRAALAYLANRARSKPSAPHTEQS